MPGGKKGGSDFREALRNLRKSFPAREALSKVAPSSPSHPYEGSLEHSFEEEMARLEVRKLGELTESEVEQEIDVEEGSLVFPGPEKDSTALEDDGALFISALGNLEKVFQDRIDPATEEPSSRRIRNFGKKRIDPEDTLDLHGLTRPEALQRVRFFLEKCSYNGLRTVLIVTGKGKGSEGEGVLRSAVMDFLEGQGGQWISAWGVAPRNLGGEGALAVFLRSRPL